MTIGGNIIDLSEEKCLSFDKNVQNFKSRKHKRPSISVISNIAEYLSSPTEEIAIASKLAANQSYNNFIFIKSDSGRYADHSFFSPPLHHRCNKSRSEIKTDDEDIQSMQLRYCNLHHQQQRRRSSSSVVNGSAMAVHQVKEPGCQSLTSTPILSANNKSTPSSSTIPIFFTSHDCHPSLNSNPTNSSFPIPFLGHNHRLSESFSASSLSLSTSASALYPLSPEFTVAPLSMPMVSPSKYVTFSAHDHKHYLKSFVKHNSLPNNNFSNFYESANRRKSETDRKRNESYSILNGKAQSLELRSLSSTISSSDDLQS